MHGRLAGWLAWLQVGLYERLGFIKDPDGIKGMAFQRRKPGSAAGQGGEQGRGKRPALLGL